LGASLAGASRRKSPLERKNQVLKEFPIILLFRIPQQQSNNQREAHPTFFKNMINLRNMVPKKVYLFTLMTVDDASNDSNISSKIENETHGKTYGGTSCHSSRGRPRGLCRTGDMGRG